MNLVIKNIFDVFIVVGKSPVVKLPRDSNDGCAAMCQSGFKNKLLFKSPARLIVVNKNRAAKYPRSYTQC